MWTPVHTRLLHGGFESLTGGYLVGFSVGATFTAGQRRCVDEPGASLTPKPLNQRRKRSSGTDEDDDRSGKCVCCPGQPVRGDSLGVT